jgi:hypothetical protein
VLEYLIPSRSIFPDLNELLVKLVGFLVDVASVKLGRVDDDIGCQRHGGRLSIGVKNGIKGSRARGSACLHHDA